jgi:hypothetical protein
MAGRPKKTFDKDLFEDYIGLGLTQEEICWLFRDHSGKSANVDTLSRWCKREYKMTFAEYHKKYGGMMRNYKLRRYQIELAKTNAAMAIFLGKNYLGQKDSFETVDNSSIEHLDQILKGVRQNAESQNERKAE